MTVEHAEPGSALDDRLRQEQARAIFDLLASTRDRERGEGDGDGQ